MQAIVGGGDGIAIALGNPLGRGAEAQAQARDIGRGGALGRLLEQGDLQVVAEEGEFARHFGVEAVLW